LARNLATPCLGREPNARVATDIVIVHLIRTYMVQGTLTTITHAMMMAFQGKTRSYIERALYIDSIPLMIETYGCFHSHFDSSFTTCA
jgi:hypothetical protein